MTEKLFEEAQEHCLVHNHDRVSFIIYKGFKLLKTEDNSVTLLDTRFTDLYSEVSQEDLSIITVKGFIKGVDLISQDRNSSRIERLEKYLEKLKHEERYAKLELETFFTPFNLKKLNNIKANIIEVEDDIKFYKIKSNIKQKQNE